MFRWGFLSTARIAREQVIPAHIAADNGVVAAIASRERSRAEALAERFGIPAVHDDYDSLLADDSIDAVYIPLPTSQHVEWSLRAAAAGKHVLCEKPITLAAEEIERLEAAADDHGVLIAEAFMVHYHPQWRRLRELIADGKIGRLRQVQGAFSYFNTDPANMRNRPELGGGGLPDIGVYPVVSTRIATGREPIRLQANVRYDNTFGTDCHASTRIDFGDFELAFYISTQLALRQEMFFHGDQGYIHMEAPFNTFNYGDTRLTLHDRDHREVKSERYAAIDHYRLQAEAFAAAAVGHSPRHNSVFSLADSWNNQAVIDAIYTSGKADSDWVSVARRAGSS